MRGMVFQPACYFLFCLYVLETGERYRYTHICEFMYMYDVVADVDVGVNVFLYHTGYINSIYFG